MEVMTHGGAASDDDLVAGQYLTFTLGSEEYAIDILSVREIRGYEQPTLIANTPPFIKGVINLRGIIVPIVDLRIKFKRGKIEYTPFTVVVILNIAGRVIGAVVDSVSDVFSLTRAQIRQAPDFSGAFDGKYILGLATIETRMMIVTNIERLMTSADMELFDSAGE